MQPYFFPYIGYYQLVHSVDEFIFFDDVSFIKKGYINRNTISNGKIPLDFTLPIENISQNKKINQHFYIKNFQKLKSSIFLHYKKKPFFPKVFSIIDGILSSDNLNVAALNSKTITEIFDYLEIEKKFSFSSSLSIPAEKKGQERIISICKLKACSIYHNPIGAKNLNLYKHSSFEEENIDLRFISRADQASTSVEKNNLSMIDTLMNYPPAEIRDCLGKYKLIT